MKSHVLPFSVPQDLLQVRFLAGRRTDLVNIALFLLGFICVVVLISPVRTFPIGDDWIYAQSVRDLLNLTYRPHDWSQAVALGAIAWGALFSLVFGLSFTTLSVATLVLSSTSGLLFYALLRHLGIPPAGALLGTVLLACNPVFIFLSYAFATDLPFLTYLLAALLCFVRGMKGHGIGWLWLGSVLVAFASLTRQFGILIVPAALLYLWLSNSWSWRRASAVALVPVVAFAAYMAWGTMQPTPLVAHSQDMQLLRAFAAQNPIGYAGAQALSFAWMFSTLSLYLIPILSMPRRTTLIIPVLAVLSGIQIVGLHFYGTMFPRNGNIVDVSGVNMGTYSAVPLWDQWAWVVLGFVSLLALSIFIASCTGGLRTALSSIKTRTVDPAVMLYLFVLLLVGTLLVLVAALYDRYILPVFPIAILAGLRLLWPQTGEGMLSAPRLGWRWLTVVPLAVFAILGQRDYMDHAAVRWQAAQQLVASGVQADEIDAGFEWAGWNTFEEGVRYLRENNYSGYVPFPPSLVSVPIYRISDLPEDGYTQVGSLPYRSWLDGGQSRQVLILRRK